MLCVRVCVLAAQMEQVPLVKSWNVSVKPKKDEQNGKRASGREKSFSSAKSLLKV